MGMFTQWSNPQYWLGVLYSLPAVLLALSIHEAAHAFVAYKCGDPTARNLGRMTLDPTKHLDPVGTICLIFFRFGWAKPVPVNSRNFKNPRRDDTLVSLAGIISNFILSFIAAGILFFSLGLGLTNEVVIRIVMPMVSLNITLAIFNLLPVPPLDGFHLVSNIPAKKSYKAVAALNRYGFIIIIALLITGVIGFLLNFFMYWIITGYDNFFGLFAPQWNGILRAIFGYGF